jgi:hypothetical protein
MAINSCSKGKRIERQLVDTLNERFVDILSQNPSWGKFSRTVGSGNRWAQHVVLSEDIKSLYTGDLVTPGKNFKFTIECKGGYNHIDLNGAFNGNREIDAFIKQAEDDAQRSGKKPMVMWQKTRKPSLAIIKMSDLGSHIKKIKFYMKYNQWAIVSLNDFLKLPDDFFFTI